MSPELPRLTAMPSEEDVAAALERMRSAQNVNTWALSENWRATREGTTRLPLTRAGLEYLEAAPYEVDFVRWLARRGITWEAWCDARPKVEHPRKVFLTETVANS